MDDVPVAGGHVELAAQLGNRFFLDRGRGLFVGFGFLLGDLLDHLIDDFLGSSVDKGVGGLLLHLFLVFLESLFLGVLFVAHDVSLLRVGPDRRRNPPAVSCGRVRRSQPKINALSLPNPKSSRPAKSMIAATNTTTTRKYVQVSDPVG